jgi:cell division septum initiation protein DivIVA
MLLRPEEIAAHRFGRRIFGADPEEVKQVLSQVAAAARHEIARTDSRIAALEGALRDARARVEQLERDLTGVRDRLAAAQESLAAAQERLAAYQEREGQVARVLLNAQRFTEEIARGAQRDAEETRAEARRTAQETVAGARRTAAQTLRDARRRAREAAHAAAARLSDAQAEADRTVSAARDAAAHVRQTAEQRVEELAAAVGGILALRSGLAEDLDALVRRHTESLERLGRLLAQAQEEVLPLLRRMQQTLHAEAGAGAQPGAAPPAPEPSRAAAGPERPGEAAPPATGRDRPRQQEHAEVLVSPVRTLLDATKFSLALSRLPGIGMARLRTLSTGTATATVDVLLEGCTLGELGVTRIPGYPVEQVDVAGTRLILRLGEPRP